MTQSEKILTDLLAHADIKINGSRPWDIQVKNPLFYQRVIGSGSLGFGESYMDGFWEAQDLAELMYRIINGNLQSKLKINPNLISAAVKARLLNMQSMRRSRKVAEQHYDLSTELYFSFLDPYNQYTCGYFKDTEDLNVAQEQKLDLICKKLQLKSTDRVLDIGCGWGGFAKFAASKYGCNVTGITISKVQAAEARRQTAGLPVEIKELDYRNLTGQFDKILICGMIEHVGYKNYLAIFKVVSRSLKDNGLFLLHTIGRNTSGLFVDPWMSKYIFPNSMLPSVKQLGASMENLFVMEDWHNFGAYYEKTLLCWFQNFDKNWHKIKDKFDERFYRMWKYYLLSCAAGFRARDIQLWQIVMSKNGVPGGYTSIR